VKKKKFEQKTQNFELPICYMIKLEVATQGIKMSRGVDQYL
jgi:hypothetical protein